MASASGSSNRRRSKRRRRWAILAAVVVTLAGSSAYVSHRRHAAAEADGQRLRTEGLAAHASGDDALAVSRLDKYLAGHAPDVETLLAFAGSRSQLDAPDGSHLRRAEQALLQAERLEPQSIAIRHALLDLLPKTTDTTALDRVADDALALNPTNPLGLRGRMIARLRQNRPAEALEAALAVAMINPHDVDAHLTVLRTMDRLGKPAADLAAYAETAFTPSDPRRALLRAAAAVPSDSARAAVLLRGLAREPIDDADLLREVVNLCDLLRRPDLSRVALETSAGPVNDRALVRLLARRLWQSGDVTTLAKAAAPLDRQDSPLIALHAAGLYASGDFDAARAVVATLAKRKDRVARAWAAALPAKFESPEPIAALQKAADACPSDAILRTWLAAALLEAGEPVLAIPHFATAMALEPAWPEPMFGRAAAMVAIGETRDAVTIAQAAYDNAKTADAVAKLIDVRFAAFDRTNDATAAQDLLDATAAVQAARPGEPQTLAVRLRLLTRTGRRDEAVRLLAGVPAGDLQSIARPVAVAAADEGLTGASPTTRPADSVATDDLDRLKAIAGEEGRQYRLARGRQLTAAVDAGSAFDAVNLLGELVYETPRQTAPRMALARALLKAGNTTAAIEHLRLAVSNDPNNPEPLAELIGLLRQTGRDEDARQVLRRTAQIPAPPTRLKLVLDRLTVPKGAGDVVTVESER